MQLESVLAEKCYGLRSTILRPGQPKANWTFATDHDPQALHMVARENGEVIAVGSLLPEPYHERSGYPWRLRGMAVIEEYRGKGVGQILLNALQIYAKEQGGGIWCTARLNVEGFYLHNGFIREGETFEMNAMPHIRMIYG